MCRWWEFLALPNDHLLISYLRRVCSVSVVSSLNQVSICDPQTACTSALNVYSEGNVTLWWNIRRCNLNQRKINMGETGSSCEFDLLDRVDRKKIGLVHMCPTRVIMAISPWCSVCVAQLIENGGMYWVHFSWNVYKWVHTYIYIYTLTGHFIRYTCPIAW